MAMTEQIYRWLTGGSTTLNLEREFEKRKPWITKFIIDGREYGGDYDALNDSRVDQFFEYFPNPHTILELGSLEGGHTFSLARRPNVKWVLGIEGREANVEKAKFIQKLLETKTVEFKTANLETDDLTSLGRFDSVFCVGVLYHLPRPWRLIEQISQVTESLFIWSHYADEGLANQIVGGYRGMMYQEAGIADPLSGLSRHSFWPDLSSLMDMLKAHGFNTIRVIEKNPNHPNGPGVTLAAMHAASPKI